MKYVIGAMVGDIVGSKYEFKNIRTKKFPLFSKGCYATDDSIMTAAVWDMWLNNCLDDKEAIIDKFKEWGRRHPNSYGGSFGYWLMHSDRNPYYSFGNGAAMRVSPIGWIAKDEEEVKRLSYNITSVTHDHPEGLKGAEVTAMCVYYARIGKSKEFIKEYVERYYPEINNFTYEDLNKHYWFNETCQNTVPQAIFCFLISNSFEDCIRTTISIGGDCDTTAAISVAIAEAYYKDISSKIIDQTLKIVPDDVLQIVKKVYNKLEV